MAQRNGLNLYSAVSEMLPFVLKYAPIFHLHSEEQYRPAPIAEFLVHTRPQIDREDTDQLTNKPTLDDLDRLKHLGVKGGTDIYLTSFDDVTRGPRWLQGTTAMDASGGTGTDATGVIIIVNKGDGIVDAFYFCFFAFNWGGIVLDHQLGNPVGDWEHVMIRFVHKIPRYIWLSQHANGEAYRLNAIKKHDCGLRPLLYIARGSHAIYPKPGDIDHTLPNMNLDKPFLLVDKCDKGALYDPLGSSYMYTYALDQHAPAQAPGDVEVPGFFDVVAPTNRLPGWLYFTGHWGDQEYPADDPRQKGKELLQFRKYGDGPTGPAFKDLMRKKVWPAGQFAAGQKIKSSVSGGPWANLRDWVAKWCNGPKLRGGVDVDGNAVLLGRK